MKKRRHHYVWKHYLKPWTSDGKIYLLRQGELHNTALVNAAQERDFYRLKEFSKPGIQLINDLIMRSPATLIPLHHNLLKRFTAPFILRDKLIKEGLYDAQSQKELDIIINDTEEELHSEVERDSQEALRLLIETNISSFSKTESLAALLIFLSMQYLRTKRNQVVAADRVTHIATDDFNSVQGILRNIISLNMSYYLLGKIHREEYKIIFLLSDNTETFITGDQPAINSYANLDTDVPTEHFDLYYPLTPNVSLYITPRIEYAGYPNGSKVKLSAEDVKSWNLAIYKWSYETIFSHSEDQLKSTVLNAQFP